MTTEGMVSEVVSEVAGLLSLAKSTVPDEEPGEKVKLDVSRSDCLGKRKIREHCRPE